MTWWSRGLMGALLGVALSAGCGARSTPPTDTGAAVAAKGYYDALLRQDWATAYAGLHADSRTRVSADEFARLARNQRRALGFEPEEIVVRSCEEQGDDAVVHVVLRGKMGTHAHSFRDAGTLKRDNQGWGIVLPVRFGQGR